MVVRWPHEPFNGERETNSRDSEFHHGEFILVLMSVTYQEALLSQGTHQGSQPQHC